MYFYYIRIRNLLRLISMFVSAVFLAGSTVGLLLFDLKAGVIALLFFLWPADVLLKEVRKLIITEVAFWNLYRKD